jgi:hypothetical protein
MYVYTNDERSDVHSEPNFGKLKCTKAKQIDEKFHSVMIVMSRTPKYVVN